MKKTKKILSSLIMILFSLFITSCGTSSDFTNEEEISTKIDSSKELVVHYIDVGQGDSELIQVDGKNILIDAGDNKDDAYYYLKKLGVTTLDYVIATHPHEDHIGGMDKVIDEMNVGTFYAPKTTTNTKTFENTINSLKKKNLQMKTPKVGEEINVGGAKLTFLAPNGDNYKEVNDYSIVAKITYGSNSFLFMGDAEELSESEILKNRLDVSADVLKVGHHGSNSSTNNNFLKKVSPTYAIISVGKDNQYGHPTDSTLKKLKSKKVFRTDLNGTIRAYSDGKKVYVYSDKKAKENTKNKKAKK